MRRNDLVCLSSEWAASAAPTEKLNQEALCINEARNKFTLKHED